MTKLVIEDCNINNEYVAFWDSVFSNFYPCLFLYRDTCFVNAEQAYAWLKAKQFGDEKRAELILKTESPMQAKTLGRAVDNFDKEVWDSISYDLMLSVVLAKFEQNPFLTRILASVGSRKFIEGSSTDLVWGVGIDWEDDLVFDKNAWLGTNWLGLVLDEVKNRLC